jgi:hypothetical protein
MVDLKRPIRYNYDIMKVNQTLRKTRAHMVLFFHNTPFKPKRVELKTRYQRKSKHKKIADFG